MANDEFYTPKRVYEVIKNWAVKRYGLEGREIIRPFYKGGGDYKRANYPKGCVVIDNPPFSIGAQIVDFYLEKGIDFFLFYQTQKGLSQLKGREGRISFIACGVSVAYENQDTKIGTSFLTNLEKENLLLVACDLTEEIRCANTYTQKG
nr:MAG TPA: adenine-specific methyltransferase [Caudoviricetes sp.]